MTEKYNLYPLHVFRVVADHSDRWYQSSTQFGLAALALQRNDVETAQVHIERALATMREIGSEDGVADELVMAAYIAMSGGDVDRARAALDDSLQLASRLRNAQTIAAALVATACLLNAEARCEPAARLLAAGLSLYRQISVRPVSVIRVRVDMVDQELRSNCGDAQIARLKPKVNRFA